MADSDITVDGLTATGGVGQVSLTWNTPVDPHTPGGLPALQFEATEIWAGPSNDRDALSTVKIGETSSTQFIHSGLSRGESNFYWIKPRQRGRVPSDGSEVHGEWSPPSATGGVAGTELNTSLLLGPEGYWERPPNGALIENWGSVVTRADGEPVLVDFPKPFPNRCLILSYTKLVIDRDFKMVVSISDIDQVVNGFQVTGYQLFGGEYVPVAETCPWWALGY